VTRRHPHICYSRVGDRVGGPSIYEAPGWHIYAQAQYVQIAFDDPSRISQWHGEGLIRLIAELKPSKRLGCGTSRITMAILTSFANAGSIAQAEPMAYRPIPGSPPGAPNLPFPGSESKDNSVLAPSAEPVPQVRPAVRPVWYFHTPGWGLTIAPNPLGRQYQQHYISKSDDRDLLIQFEWRISSMIFTAASDQLFRTPNISPVHDIRPWFNLNNSLGLRSDASHQYGAAIRHAEGLGFRGEQWVRIVISRSDTRKKRDREDEVYDGFRLTTEEYARFKLKLAEFGDRL
jgi:hypothetical protein